MPPTEGPTDGKAAIPLYQQVIDIIKNEINSGAYKAGARIPNEFELAESYKVGRVTVRRAIEELVQQGYLTKRQGKGTFVNAPKLKRKIRQKDDVQSFSDACRVNGMEPGACVISRKILPADSTEAQFFGVPVGTDLICVERVRTADGVPVMLENNIYVYEDNAYLSTAPLSNQSIFEFVRNRTGRTPAFTDPCTLEIACASPEVARLLAVPVGEPLFYMMSSGGRLSSVVSGSLGLATFLTSRTLRMETPGGSSHRAFPYRSRRKRNRSTALRQSV